MKVENPGGVQNLIITFTIISERPIERNNVVNVPSIYQVAEVCLKNISTNRLIFFQDYSQRNETPTGKIRIIEDSDEEGDDTAKDYVEKSWRMKKDVENHIEEMTGGSIDQFTQQKKTLLNQNMSHGNLKGYMKTKNEWRQEL